MHLSLLKHSALVLSVQRTRIPTSSRSIGFSVPFGFVLVRVRVRKEISTYGKKLRIVESFRTILSGIMII